MDVETAELVAELRAIRLDATSAIEGVDQEAVWRQITMLRSAVRLLAWHLEQQAGRRSRSNG